MAHEGKLRYMTEQKSQEASPKPGIPMKFQVISSEVSEVLGYVKKWYGNRYVVTKLSLMDKLIN